MRVFRLARRHRGRRLGLDARGGDERRGRFLGEPRALPTKLQQEAKSKSQSPSLQTERHPISWERERELNRMTSRADLSSPAQGGNFQRASRLAAGKSSLYLVESREPQGSNADGAPSPWPPTQSLEPDAPRRAASDSSKTAARPDLDSAASGAPRQRAESAGRRTRGTGFPLVLRRRRLQFRN